MVGIIDEIRMPVSESTRFPVLVDTKTRVRATLPSEPQKRNGRYSFNRSNSSFLLSPPPRHFLKICVAGFS